MKKADFKHELTLTQRLVQAPTLDALERNSSAHRNSTLPSATAYGQLQVAGEFLNQRLFGGALPDVLFTMSRKKNRQGYFGARFFENADGQHAHEISLNPAYFRGRPLEDTLSTMAHELAHEWRHEFGLGNRKGGTGSSGYHDLVWHVKMLQIGLVPVYGFTRSGRISKCRVSHTIEQGGPFDLACRELILSGFRIDWHDRQQTPGPGKREHDNSPTKQGVRARFDCPGCALHAWAKASAKLQCGSCHATMTLQRKFHSGKEGAPHG
jgi:hypothetical protein